MVVVPLHSPPHSSVVPVVNGFSSISSYMRLLAKFIEKDVKTLALVLGQSNQSMVEWQ
jgi:hypothetical protein